MTILKNQIRDEKSHGSSDRLDAYPEVSTVMVTARRSVRTGVVAGARVVVTGHPAVVKFLDGLGGTTATLPMPTHMLMIELRMRPTRAPYFRKRCQDEDKRERRRH